MAEAGPAAASAGPRRRQRAEGARPRAALRRRLVARTATEDLAERIAELRRRGQEAGPARIPGDRISAPRPTSRRSTRSPRRAWTGSCSCFPSGDAATSRARPTRPPTSPPADDRQLRRRLDPEIGRSSDRGLTASNRCAGPDHRRNMLIRPSRYAPQGAEQADGTRIRARCARSRSPLRVVNAPHRCPRSGRPCGRAIRGRHPAPGRPGRSSDRRRP